MNKSYRVIWSSVRNCFVVTDERSKAKGKPSSTKKAIAAALAGIFFAPAIASAEPSCSGLNPVTGALTTTQCYSVDEDIKINNGASVTVDGDPAVVVYLPDYTKSFVNNGTLRATESAAQTATGDEVGSSGVFALSDSIYSSGLFVDGTLSGSLTNSSTGVINSAIDVSAISAATDTNYAHAYAGFYGQSYTAGVLTSQFDGQFLNSGKIGATALSNTSANATVSSISSDADDYAYVFAYSGGITAAGVAVNGDLNGSFINGATGVISAQASQTASAVGAINNSGTTTGDAYLSSVSSAYSMAYGVTVDGAMGAGSSLINRGVINVSALASVSATSAVPLAYDYAYAYAGAAAYSYAYGIVTSAIGEGALVQNTGTINVTANSTSSAIASSEGYIANLTQYNYDDAYYYNSVVGHQVFAAQSDAAEAVTRGYAYAYGVLLSNGINGGAFINDGTINVTTSSQNSTTATGYSDDVLAYTYGGSNAIALGLDDFYDGSVWTSLAGTVTNNGTLNATSNITSAATATSTAAYDNAYAFAESDSGGWADATGIYLNSYMGADSRLINNGIINANANMSSSHGVSNATVTGEYAYAYAYAGARGWSESVGIRVRGLNDNASIINEGVINSVANTTVSALATATASLLSEAYAYSETRAYANAYGILISYGGMRPDASVINNGDINAIATVNTTATSTATGDAATADAYAYAYAYATGMHSQRGLETGASFVNNGTITAVANANATATAANGTDAVMYARAYGMNLRGTEVAADSFITNTGTISATAIGNDTLAVGINVGTQLNGTLNNSGSISAFTSDDPSHAYSIRAYSGSGTINNL